MPLLAGSVHKFSIIRDTEVDNPETGKKEKHRLEIATLRVVDGGRMVKFSLHKTLRLKAEIDLPLDIAKDLHQALQQGIRLATPEEESS